MVAEVLFPGSGILSVLAIIAIIAVVALAFRESNQAGGRFLVATVLSMPLGGRRVDVVTGGEWIEAGEPVKVVELRGSRVVVVRVTRPDETTG